MKIGFSIYFTQERRKKILEAILSGGRNNMTVEGKRMIGKYADQVDNQIKRLKEEREEMQAAGRRIDPSEQEQFNFFTRRIKAYDNNDVDPDNLKRITAELMANRSK